MFYRLSALSIALLVPCLSFAQLEIMPVHDSPRWKVVSGIPQAPGAAVAVSALATNQVIGQIRPDEKFLSFGTDGQVITLAFNGTIGYIPATAARDLYPIEQQTTAWRAWGKTLEEIAQEEAGEKDITKISLKPRKTETPTGAAGGAGGAPGAALDPGIGNPAVTGIGDR